VQQSLSPPVTDQVAGSPAAREARLRVSGSTATKPERALDERLSLILTHATYDREADENG
jgi:hypothetical protein